jgi:predicted transcriptional regulator
VGYPPAARTRVAGDAHGNEPLTPKRKAQLDDYAQRHGRDPVAALDNALADYLDWERQDFKQAVEGIRAGYEDVKAGRTRPADVFPDELRRKYGFPR